MEKTTNVVPGECVAVCAACGMRVHVPIAAGVPPWLVHERDCPRMDWPIVDATMYAIGTAEQSQATVRNWSRR